MIDKRPIRSYRDLRVYQQSMELLGPIHQLVLGFPDYEKYALADQMRRASRSVPTNIVEGYSRRSSAKDFKHFMAISMGSANEMVVHIEICRQLKYCAPEPAIRYAEAYEAIGKQLHMLMARWKSNIQHPTSNIVPACRRSIPMRFTFTPAQQSFRTEVQAFLHDALPADWEGADNAIDDESYAFGRQFLRKLAPKHWIAPAWPKQYGGLEMDLWDQVIFNECMGYARAPIVNTAAVGYLGPTVILYGTEEQKQQHLPGITSGDVVWCQGYSEPNSGSDLASLQTRAVQDGDDFIINGQKIWTSQAHYADWMFVLARTDPDAPKHRGISYFLMDMKTPGVTVRPLINMANGEGFNEVFFENVRVPRSGLLGELNRGWYIATTTLDFERSSIGGTSQALRSLEDLTRFAKTESQGNGKPLWDKPTVRNAIADLWIDLEMAQLLSYRVVSMQARGLVPNYEASIIKVFTSEYVQRQARIGAGIMGLYGQLWQGSPWEKLRSRFAKSYVTSVGSAIAGGTSEIQRNIIAQRGLGLPRQ